MLFYYNLLYLNIVSIDKAEHVDTRNDIETFLVATIEAFTAEDAPHDIDDLQRGLTFDAKDAEVATVINETEGL